MKNDPFTDFLTFLEAYPSFHYKKGERLLRPEESPHGIFILKKGYVKLFASSQDGEELTLVIYKPDDFFPMLWAFTETPSKYYAEAMTTTEVKRVPREAFLQFVKTHPDVLVELTTRILTRLGGLLERMEYLVFGSAKNRVASILLILSERFGKKLDGTVMIDCSITHKDISNLVGITRETTSSIMSNFLKRGYLVYKGRHIVIKNRQGLLAESLLDADN